MLAKGFSVNGAIPILVDINEKYLLEAKRESEEAARSVSVTAKVEM
jgi:hypothetical protein